VPLIIVELKPDEDVLETDGGLERWFVVAGAAAAVAVAGVVVVALDAALRSSSSAISQRFTFAKVEQSF
jgi:hypothetical protein